MAPLHNIRIVKTLSTCAITRKPLALWLFGTSPQRPTEKGHAMEWEVLLKGCLLVLSLQRPYNEQIMTPRQLYDWAEKSIPSVTFQYCTNQEHAEEAKLLEAQFSLARPRTKKEKNLVKLSFF
jgi:hypothetical protein